MGSGIALSIRNKWDDVYNAYMTAYHEQGLKLGDIVTISGKPEPFPWRQVDVNIDLYSGQLAPDIIIVNAMTQFECGNDKKVQYADYDAISAAFARIKILARDTGLPVHFPLIGAGLANGKWEEIEPLIVQALGPNIEKHLWLYKP